MNGLADVLRALKHDPDRFRFLVRFGLFGALIVVAFGQLGTDLLPFYVVLPVTMILLLAYAGVLTLTIARAVHAAARWQFESSLTAEKLMTAGRRARDEAAAGVSHREVETSFHQTYFLIRLDEEVKRARREGQPLSLLCLDVTLPGHGLTPDVLEAVAYDVAQLASSQARTITLSTTLAPTVFALCLPGMNAGEAKAYLRKVLQNLGNYWCQYGIASYPHDATDATSLLEEAWQNCERARQAADAERPRAVPV